MRAKVARRLRQVSGWKIGDDKALQIIDTGKDQIFATNPKRRLYKQLKREYVRGF